MGRRRCCCPPCWSFTDDFNRSNNTDLGGDWEELTGDSEILNNELFTPVAAKVLCTQPHPKTTPTCFIYLKLTSLAAGSRHEIRVNANEDGTGGELVYVQCTATTIVIGVGDPSDDEVTAWQDSPIPSSIDITICRPRDAIFADQTYGPKEAWACMTEADGGRYVTLRNGGTTDITWDDFEYWEHKFTHPDCPGCPCTCDGWCVPKELTLTLTDVSGCCDPCYSGLSCTLVSVSGGRYTHGSFAWEGSMDIPWMDCDDPIGGPVTTNFRLVCAYGTCGQPAGRSGWILYSDIICNGGWSPPAPTLLTACPTTIECDPFFVKYEDLYCTHLKWVGPGPADYEEIRCDYAIEITE